MGLTMDDILDLEELDTNLFRSQHHYENFRKSLFGGQVLGQALMAAYKTTDDALPNSLHAYFLRAGSSASPVIYDVENVRDGRTFSCRRVVARQSGRPIYNMSASFHAEEEGFQHQVEYPEHVPLPEELLKDRAHISMGDKVLKAQGPDTPFHFLPVDDALFSTDRISPPEGYFWIKAKDKLPDTPISHYCALAFASDIGLLATALLPHNSMIFDENLIVASVDHAMWFHRKDFRADEWLLCKNFSPWAGNARGFAQAHIFNLDKQLVASTAQEGLIRKI